MSNVAVFLIAAVFSLMFSLGLVNVKARRVRGTGRTVSRLRIFQYSLYIWLFVVAILASMIFSPGKGPWWFIILGGELFMCVVAIVVVTQRRRRRRRDSNA